MAVLYVNSKGVGWRKHSYSAGNDWDQCPLKYQLRRIHGWKPKDTKGSFKFGRAIEEAIQFHHENNGKGGVEDFIRRWAVHQNDETITYTKTEKDWASLNKAGIEMMKLYLIRQPSLPIPIGGQSVFQREYSKEVFPEDPNYGEIEDAGKLDIVCYVDPEHPMLPKVQWKPEYGVFRPVIVDIKTMGTEFSERQGMAAFDKQLRRYSWLSGIYTVAFLWFKKTGHSLQKGSSVTLLIDCGEFKAGDEAVVAQIIGDRAYIVRNDFVLAAMNDAQGRKEDGSIDQTKAAKQRKADWLAINAVLLFQTDLTRQRLQFNAGYVTKESAKDAGRIAARQIQEIVNAWKNNEYPSTFGIRYPSDDSNDPYFRAFVLKEAGFREANFEQSDESMDDLFADFSDVEGEEE